MMTKELIHELCVLMSYLPPMSSYFKTDGLEEKIAKKIAFTEDFIKRK